MLRKVYVNRAQNGGGRYPEATRADGVGGIDVSALVREEPMMWQTLFPLFAKSLENHDRCLKACFVVLVVHDLCSSECERGTSTP